MLPQIAFIAPKKVAKHESPPKKFISIRRSYQYISRTNDVERFNSEIIKSKSKETIDVSDINRLPSIKNIRITRQKRRIPQLLEHNISTL